MRQIALVVIRKFMMFGPVAAAVTSFLTLSGCIRKDVDDVRLIDIETQVEAYYKTKARDKTLVIREVRPGEPVEGFCILSAYEDRVTPDSEAVISVNAFLDAQGIEGKEEYWHLVIKTPKGLRFARFDTAHTPLVSPRPGYAGKSCAVARSIIFQITSVPAGGMPLLGVGPKEKIVINAQPGD
jgi:hypothetical protein